MRPQRSSRERTGERVGVRRAVVFLPNGFTLFNLFCGIFAIVLSSRGNFDRAALFVVLGGIADMMDGRVARATGTGSKFGEELDSLVDAISFGLAPALIMFFAVLNQTNWQWLLVFIFASCAVMRLARFNVEQAGRKKTHFHGLPSPAAGLTLATYYWFSQTELYSQTVILFTDDKTLKDLPWQTLMSFLMAILAALMISNVPYPAFPPVGYKTMRQRLGSLVVLGSILGLIFIPKKFIFPACVAYVLFGVVKFFLLGLVGKASSPEEIYWDRDPNVPIAPSASRSSRPAASAPLPIPENGVLVEDEGGVDRVEDRDRERSQRRRKRRRGRGPRPGPPFPPEPPRDPNP
ncbi:MAG TPA: CDP-diacylglycerol--serine O-phosphatidyltransferase [Gemmatimonadaceae bacterium]|nr:CDP-diacylglycerol--serine O-phosphatidyltransferase [Gemmatimonadaceae bacterium]